MDSFTLDDFLSTDPVPADIEKPKQPPKKKPERAKMAKKPKKAKQSKQPGEAEQAAQTEQPKESEEKVVTLRMIQSGKDSRADQFLALLVSLPIHTHTYLFLL